MIAKLLKVLLIYFILFTTFMGALISCQKREEPQAATLEVDGKNIYTEYCLIYSNYETIPLAKTLEALGFAIEWETDTVANLTYGENGYVLSLSELSLTGEKMGNVLIAAPGSRIFSRKAIEKDIIVDIDLFRSAVYLMDMNVSVNCNRETKCIYVETQGTVSVKT